MIIKICTRTAKSAPFRTVTDRTLKRKIRIGAETQPPHIAGPLWHIIRFMKH